MTANEFQLHVKLGNKFWWAIMLNDTYTYESSLAMFYSSQITGLYVGILKTCGEEEYSVFSGA